MNNNFNQQKKAILLKQDKSSKGNWDEKIAELCNRINSMQDYYTTSSCSGRIVLIVDNVKKSSGLFVKVWHKEINFKELKKILEKSLNKKIVFKQEPPILHIACRTSENAFNFLKKARLAGFKRAGVISGGKRFVLEIMSTEKLEFPIIKNNKLLVSDCFLKLIIEKSNNNLKRGWKKINDLEKRI